MAEERYNSRMNSDADRSIPLARYAQVQGHCRIVALRAAGGFSGAQFWRIECSGDQQFCLRRWPSEHPNFERLRWIHSVLCEVADRGLPMIPRPLPSVAGDTIVRHAGFFWELTPWMPGRADFRNEPTIEKLTDAMQTLANFHLAAADCSVGGMRRDVSPGICRRLGMLMDLQQGGLREITVAIEGSRNREFVDHAHSVVQFANDFWIPVAAKLSQGNRLAVNLQPCIRDVWHDHLLFSGNRVTGLIDFGALDVDCVATDIARLLGSLALSDELAWQAGLEAYQEIRPLDLMEMQLVDAFDASSVLLSGFNWLRWIFVEERRFEDPVLVEARLKEIIERMRHRRTTISLTNL